MAPSWGLAGGLVLDADEAAWVAAHKNQTFSVAFDPYAGMDSFEYRGRRTGFLHALLDDLGSQVGLRFVPADVSGWDDAYGRFVDEARRLGFRLVKRLLLLCDTGYTGRAAFSF